MPETTLATPKTNNNIPNTLVSPMTVKQLGLSLIPFTPVPFTGDKCLLAYIRVGIYGLLAYWTWNGARPVSYAMLGATAVSVATSLSAGAWFKEIENSIKNNSRVSTQE